MTSVNPAMYERAKDRNEGREPDELHLAYETEMTRLRAENDLQRAKLRDLEHLFDIQWRRMQKATELWRAEDPKTRALIRPDLGDMLQWLMDRGDPDRAAR